MTKLVESAAAADQLIRDDMASYAAGSGLVEHCIARLHAGVTVHLSTAIVYLDTDGNYITTDGR